MTLKYILEKIGIPCKRPLEKQASIALLREEKPAPEVKKTFLYLPPHFKPYVASNGVPFGVGAYSETAEEISLRDIPDLESHAIFYMPYISPIQGESFKYRLRLNPEAWVKAISKEARTLSFPCIWEIIFCAQMGSFIYSNTEVSLDKDLCGITAIFTGRLPVPEGCESLPWESALSLPLEDSPVCPYQMSDIIG